MAETGAPTAPYDTERAARRLWTMRHLMRERAMDPIAADGAAFHLAQHPNPRIRALAEQTRCDLADRAIDHPEQQAI